MEQLIGSMLSHASLTVQTALQTALLILPSTAVSPVLNTPGSIAVSYNTQQQQQHD